MNEIKVSTENVQKAFHAAGENPAIRELLINLFGKENVEPEQSKDVKERIKTFEDACKELGNANPLVFEYNKAVGISNNVKAYLQLRIICAALNEGWEPKFTTDEYRYYPKEEIDDMNEEDKGRVGCRYNYSANVNGGLVVAFANNVSSYANTLYASRLVFKSGELAEYAGKQFADIWDDFVFKVR